MSYSKRIVMLCEIFASNVCVLSLNLKYLQWVTEKFEEGLRIMVKIPDIVVNMIESYSRKKRNREMTKPTKQTL